MLISRYRLNAFWEVLDILLPILGTLWPIVYLEQGLTPIPAWNKDEIFV